jgi:hypothetical protein
VVVVVKNAFAVLALVFELALIKPDGNFSLASR